MSAASVDSEVMALKAVSAASIPDFIALWVPLIYSSAELLGDVEILAYLWNIQESS
jgi:hypothetical protein